LAYSGHYRPSEEELKNFMKYLEEHGVDLKDVEVLLPTWYLDLIKKNKER
jgi:exoribonuclease R